MTASVAEAPGAPGATPRVPAAAVAGLGAFFRALPPPGVLLKSGAGLLGAGPSGAGVAGASPAGSLKPWGAGDPPPPPILVAAPADDDEQRIDDDAEEHDDSDDAFVPREPQTLWRAGPGGGRRAPGGGFGAARPRAVDTSAISRRKEERYTSKIINAAATARYGLSAYGEGDAADAAVARRARPAAPAAPSAPAPGGTAVRALDFDAAIRQCVEPATAATYARARCAGSASTAPRSAASRARRPPGFADAALPLGSTALDARWASAATPRRCIAARAPRRCGAPHLASAVAAGASSLAAQLPPRAAVAATELVDDDDTTSGVAGRAAAGARARARARARGATWREAGRGRGGEGAARGTRAGARAGALWRAAAPDYMSAALRRAQQHYTLRRRGCAARAARARAARRPRPSARGARRGGAAQLQGGSDAALLQRRDQAPFPSCEGISWCRAVVPAPC